MTEEEKKDVASCISSILTSTTRRMNVGQLRADFKNTVGYDIPFRKFGYDTPDDFLRTLCDKVQLFGSGPSAEVQVVITAKTAHINDLVSKQRVPKSKPPRRICNRYSTPNRLPTRRKFDNYTYYNSNRSYSNEYPKVPLSSSFDNQRSLPSCSNSFQKEPLPSLFDQPISPPPSCLNIPQKDSPQSHEHRKTPQLCWKESPQLLYESSKPQMESFQETAAATGTTYRGSMLSKNHVADTLSEPSELFFSDEEEEIVINTKIPQIVQDNLRKLILKHPEGVWCSSLLNLYRKDFAKTLNYGEYGYRSVAHMCADLGNIFTIVQLDKNDVKLFAKNQPIPQDTVNIIAKLEMIKMKANAERPTENAVPELEITQIMGDIYTEKAPPDVVEFGSKLEQQWIDPGTNEQDFIDVNIGEVYDPSKFWMNLKQYGIQLNTLMDNMQVFYNEQKEALAVPYLALRKNMFVACIFSNEYHRAKIVDVSQRNEGVIKVYFVDYGTVSVIPIETVCYLHKQFADLPEQAIRARLGGIYPVNENEQWSRSAASRFLGFVMQKDLIAQIIHIDEERKILDIILADTSEEDEDFFINDALVGLGYAVFTFQDRQPAEPTGIVPIVRYIHLFPTFSELENGLVPNALQMISMHQAGLCIEQIYPHYFKDVRTGQPISISRIPVNRTQEALEQTYQTIEGADNDFTAGITAEPPKLNWSDAIEEKPEDEMVEEEVNCEDEVEVDSPGLTSTSVQTDDDLIAEDSEKSQKYKENLTDNTNLTNINIVDKSDASVDTNLPDTSIIKKTLRPPPGYHITPQNVTINYNCNGPSNYLSNQTCINPMQSPPAGYGGYYVDPVTQQRNSLYYLNCLMRGLMVQNAYQPMYPQGYPPMGPNYMPMAANYPPLNPGYPINNGMNPYFWPPQQQYNNMPAAPPSNINTNMPIPTSINMNMANNSCQFDSSLVNTSKIQPTAKEFIPRCHLTLKSNNESSVESRSSDSDTNINIPSNDKNDEAPRIQIPISSNNNNKSIIPNTEIPHDLNENDTEDVELDVKFAENSSKIFEETQVLDREDELLLIKSEAGNESEEELFFESSEVEETDINEIYDKIRNSKMSEIDESDYETCFSSDRSGSNFIRIIGSDDLNLHAINYDGGFYFLLTEVSNKLFGKSLTVLQIRRLSVGIPHIISVVDIRLRTNPELKKELSRYGLISENASSVDAIPIKYLSDLTTIIPCGQGGEVMRVEELLKDVEVFYRSECEL